MANTSAIRQQAAHTTYQLSSPSCSTTAIQKRLTLNESVFFGEFSGKKSQENGPLEKNYKTERARGLDRKKQERR